VVFQIIRLRGWRSCRASLGLRMRLATRPARLRPLVGTNFRLLCGEDALALPYFAQGGDGCISVTSNVAPGLCRNMFLAWKQGQSVRAQRLARPIAELTTVLFRETNPVPLKQALALLGLMSSFVVCRRLD
jgi:4-hydroxy-tetrahydrodipicolinate synthase